MCLFCLKGATRGNKSNGVEATIISSFPEGIAPLTDIVQARFFRLVSSVRLFLSKRGIAGQSITGTTPFVSSGNESRRFDTTQRNSRTQAVTLKLDMLSFAQYNNYGQSSSPRVKFVDAVGIERESRKYSCKTVKIIGLWYGSAGPSKVSIQDPKIPIYIQRKQSTIPINRFIN